MTCALALGIIHRDTSPPAYQAEPRVLTWLPMPRSPTIDQQPRMAVRLHQHPHHTRVSAIFPKSQQHQLLEIETRRSSET